MPAPLQPRITLVLGGARSGKSVVAERLATRASEPVTYVATMEIGNDAELAERVAHHRLRRPAGWCTLEIGSELVRVLAELTGTVLVDSLGPWVTMSAGRPDVDGLCHHLQTRAGHSIVVSEEVGFSVHPSSESGRRFRDELGTVNQAVAAIADDVLLVVAGRSIRLSEPVIEG